MNTAQTKSNELTPIFIGGHPKSGSTLLLALLDWHPEVVVFPEELKFYARFYPRSANEKIAKIFAKTAGVIASDTVQFQSGSRDYSTLNSTLYYDDLKNRLAKVDSGASDGSYIDAIIGAFKEELIRQGFKDEFKCFCEKTPGNELRLGKIKADYPNYRMLYILRDPRDLFFTYRKKDTSLTIKSFCYSWKQSIRAVLNNPNVYIIRYEDLITNPSAELSKLTSWLNISYVDSLLRPTRFGQSWSGNSMHNTNTPNKINQYALQDRWRALPDKSILEIESYLYPYMKRFSYTLEHAKKKSYNFYNVFAFRFPILAYRRFAFLLKRKLKSS